MPLNLVEALRTNGPMSSSELISRIAEDGTSRITARQRVARASKEIKRLQGITLPNRQAFLYLQEQFRTDGFYESLSEVLIKSGSAQGSLIRGLIARRGIVRTEYGPIASGLSVNPTKGQVLYPQALAQLQALGMVREHQTPSGTYLALASGVYPAIDYCRAAEVVYDIVLAAIKDWLIKLNFGSPNTLQIRTPTALPLCGQFAFDFVGPSYVSALRRANNKNGFIVGDVILDRELDLSDISPYLKKLDSLYSQRRSTAIQGILIADGYEIDALAQLRSRGVILAGPTSVFGPELGKDIRSLIGILQNAAAVVANDPSELYALLSRLQKIEGVALNLRGTVLELVVAHCFLLDGYMVDIRQQVKGAQGLAEIDVKATKHSEVVCCECKGMSSGNLVGKQHLEEWLSTSLPRIKEWLKESRSLPDAKRFEFYSSTGYTDEALKLIAETERKHRKQPIRFLTGKHIMRKLKDEKLHQLAELYKEQFEF